MKIGAKITLGFSSVLAMTAVVGMIGWGGLDGYASGVEEAQTMSELVVDLHRLTSHIASFERDNDLSELNAAKGILDEALQHVVGRAGGETASSLASMADQLRDYREVLERYETLHSENLQQQAVMSETTRDIDDNAKQIYDLNYDRYATGLFILEDLEKQSELRFAFLEGANGLMHSTLAARKAELEYQLDPTPEARERAASFMKEIYLSNLSLRKIAKGTGEEGDAIKALSKGVKTYRKLFGAFIEAVDDQSGITEAKAALYAESQRVQSLAEGVAARQKKAFESISGQAQTARGNASDAFAAVTQAMALRKTLIGLRDAEKEFFRRRDPAIGEQISSMTDAASQTLAELAERTKNEGAFVEQTLALLPNYSRAFASASAASFGEVDTLVSMRELEVSVLQLANESASQAATDMADLHAWGRLTLAVFCMIALIGGVSISILTGRSIVRPLRALTSSIADLARGNAAIAIPELDRTDEIGDMARSMGIIRETGAIAVRAQKTLENTEACLMMIDRDGNVVHVNPAFCALAAQVREAVGTQLSGFAAQQFERQSFDAFHNEPALKHERLCLLTDPTGALITAAGHTFDLKVNPIFDEGGAPIGSVVSWHDCTLQLRLESEVEALIDAAAAGNLGGRLAIDHVEGFMLTLCQGMNRLIDTVEGGVKAASGVMSALAAGDLTCKMTGSYNGIFEELQGDSNRMRSELSSIATNIVRASDALHVAVKEITSGTADLTARTQAQSNAVDQTSSSMMDLTETVKRNTKSAMEANQIAAKTQSAADSGHQAVGQAVTAMEGIQTAAAKITDIVSMIDEIAFQTNLLALNAAVEAARAGDAGKGFAVVASEVRALAQRSAQASGEIKDLIENTVNEVGSGVTLVQEVGDGLQDIVGSVNTLTGLVSEIARAGQEQTGQIADASKAVTGMGTMADQNAALAEQTMAAVRSQGEQVGELHRLVRFFQVNSDESRTG